MPGKRFTAEKIINMMREVKVLWSDAGENIIIYDCIVHWGIDLLPQRL